MVVKDYVKKKKKKKKKKEKKKKKKKMVTMGLDSTAKAVDHVKIESI